MIKSSYIVLILALLLMFNCKSSRIAGDDKVNLKLNTKQLIKENTKQTPNFKTLYSKLKITYFQGESSQTHSVSLRFKKDEKIWMSAMFSVVKVLITPEKVSFYNKLDNTYFEGDFSYLSNLLGVEVDFNKLQNLLIGEALYSLDSKSYKSFVMDESYVLQPKKQDKLLEIFYIVDPLLFKMKSQQIHQAKSRRHLEIDYNSYQKVNEQIIPESIRIVALDSNNEIAIDLEYKNVSLNDKLKFPFKIPSGYDKIKL